MSTLATKLITADELSRMPADGFRYELVKGKLLRMPFNGIEHGSVTMALASLLYQHVKSNDFGRVFSAETGFKLESNPDTVRAPDIAFVSKSRIRDTGGVERYRRGAPDLVVEIMSPGDAKREMAEKINEYFASGAQVTWIVNTRFKTVTVYTSPLVATTMTKNDMLDAGNVVPGFRIVVSEIFAV